MPLLKLKVICSDLPGKRFADVHNSGNVYEPVFLGIQRAREVVNPAPADLSSVTFEFGFTVSRRSNGKPNLTGPFAQGTPDDRFFYLSWVVLKRSGKFEIFRRLKIDLTGLSWARVQKALKTGRPIEVRLKLTGPENDPLCALPSKQHITWK